MRSDSVRRRHQGLYPSRLSRQPRQDLHALAKRFAGQLPLRELIDVSRFPATAFSGCPGKGSSGGVSVMRFAAVNEWSEEMIRTTLLLPVVATLLGFASVSAQAQTSNGATPCPPGQVMGPVIGRCHPPFQQQPAAPAALPKGPAFYQKQQLRQQQEQQGGGAGPCPQGQTRGPRGHCH